MRKASLQAFGCNNMNHLTSRIYRKLLSYSLGMKLNIQSGKSPMVSEDLIESLIHTSGSIEKTILIFLKFHYIAPQTIGLIERN